MTIVKFWLGGVSADVSGEKPVRELVPESFAAMLRDHLSINSTAVVTITKKGIKVGGVGRHLTLKLLSRRRAHPHGPSCRRRSRGARPRAPASSSSRTSVLPRR